MVNKLGPVLNALNPDLCPFESKGHKLIVYHGWADSLVPPGEAINYREAVLASRLNNAGTNANPGTIRTGTDRFYRLFMIPGMAHCSGGPGFTGFSGLGPLVKWAEQGIAPDSVVVSSKAGGAVAQRPVRPYPQVAKYNG